MIQLNLLPDVKLQYIHAQRTRRLVSTVSVIVAGVCLAVFILLFALTTYQKSHLSGLESKVNTSSANLRGEPQINQILTIQNQTSQINKLLPSDPQESKLLDFLNQITPSNISISDLSVNFASNTITVTGDSNSLASVNTYVDTIKFTDIADSKGDDTKQTAFSAVVLSSFGYNYGVTNPAQAVNYTVTFKYNPVIFIQASNLGLFVPNETSTRSILDQPNNSLFQESPSTKASSTSSGGNQ